ncbi:Hypothetical protein PHPALM_20329 [Phytophthora palmivora]|uniref:Uncharacterized protein n=1 Tax=Phytophthora palmivora TaxID=4796 RepID=A0A2P4XF60_9STRA|nr:Hypothetical protein PHPALM_20329 [Phytophthora palmivora]
MGDSTASSAPTTTKQVKKRGAWSTDEKERYCEGVKLFRFGSWKRIADHVGTRTVSQVMSHAQSVRAKKKRCEDREKRYQTRVIPRSCASSHGSVNQKARKTTSQNSTAEDLLIASLLESTHTDAQQSKPAAVITSDGYSDDT